MLNLPDNFKFDIDGNRIPDERLRTVIMALPKDTPDDDEAAINGVLVSDSVPITASTERLEEVMLQFMLEVDVTVGLDTTVPAAAIYDSQFLDPITDETDRKALLIIGATLGIPVTG